jgi:hypothetical protein
VCEEQSGPLVLGGGGSAAIGAAACRRSVEILPEAMSKEKICLNLKKT